jgi:serine/threonine protein kinase
MTHRVLDYISGLQGFEYVLNNDPVGHSTHARRAAAMPLDGRFEMLWKIGAGGMGVVYLAYDQHQNTFVAVKTARQGADSNFKQRFDREKEILGTMRHSHIPSRIHSGFADGLDYIVMEAVDGYELHNTVPRGGLSNDMLSAAICKETAEVLSYAHDNQITHRDLKPANLLYTPKGIVVMDFGLARETGSIRQTAPQHAVGTPGYVSPEQLLGEPGDFRSDVFSLGATLYFLLTGYNPSEREIRHPEFSALSTLDIEPSTNRELDHIVAKMTKANADERYQTMREVIAALDSFSQSNGGYNHQVGHYFNHLHPHAQRADTEVQLAMQSLDRAQQKRKTHEYAMSIIRLSNALRVRPVYQKALTLWRQTCHDFHEMA